MKSFYLSKNNSVLAPVISDSHSVGRIQNCGRFRWSFHFANFLINKSPILFLSLACSTNSSDVAKVFRRRRKYSLLYKGSIYISNPIVFRTSKWVCFLYSALLITRLDGLLASTKSLIQTINSAKLDPDVEVIVAPPAIYLLFVKEHLTNDQVQVAAQNVFDKAQGAYTGEISFPIPHLRFC